MAAGSDGADYTGADDGIVVRKSRKQAGACWMRHPLPFIPAPMYTARYFAD